MKGKESVFIIPLLGAVLIGLSFIMPDWGKQIFLLVGIISLTLGVIVVLYLWSKPKNEIDYRIKFPLMSAPELKLQSVLKERFEPKYIVLPQVSLLSIVEKKKGAFRSELFRIIDFVVFDECYKPVCAIELNDASHQLKERKERDEKVKAILDDAGIPVLFLTLSELEDDKALKKALSKIG